MGYTHYWRLNPKGNEKNFQAALADIRVIIRNAPHLLSNGMGDIGSKPEYEKHIQYNGRGEDSHETFYLPETLAELLIKKEGSFNREPDEDGLMFDFCKTANKPYDFVVVACLAALAFHLGKDVRISSDGEAYDWKFGVEFANTVLGKFIPNPFDPSSVASIKQLSQEQSDA